MEQVPSSQTMDSVVLLLTILALAVGLVSMFVGWVHARFFANDDADLLSSDERAADEQNDEQPAVVTISAALYGELLDARAELLSSDRPDGIETPDTTSIELVGESSIPPLERDIICAMARVRDEQGKYKYSANEIDKAFKVNRNDVLKWVRETRNKEGEIPDIYHSEPVAERPIYSRTDPVVGYVDNRPVKRAANGEEYVFIGNQYMPRDLYEANADMIAA